MKKIWALMFALVVLAGCNTYYDYYKSGVRYPQDGDDCVFYSGEHGRYFSGDIRSLDADNKIVYRNTKCRDLYNADMMGQPARQDRKIVVPVATKKVSFGSKCGCAKKCKYVKVN